MALSMHTNYASLVTQNSLNGTNNVLNKAMERLATGYRINSAADDAAGLQIASRIESNTRGMSTAMRNAQDGISMMQTAEGAFDEMTNIAYRITELATQASNGTNSEADRASLNAEVVQLGEELTNIMDNSSFAGVKLFNGGGFTAAVKFQIGAEAAQDLSVDVSANLTAITTAITNAAMTTGAGVSGADDTNATAVLTAMNDSSTNKSLIDALGEARAALGANINRLEHTVTNLGNMVENTTAAKGRIMDADFAVESSNMTKNQMLMQAGTTVLSQTNQIPSMAMSLLR